MPHVEAIVMKELAGLGPVPSSFVDLGCGRGGMLKAALESKLFATIVGVEIDEKICTKARKECPEEIKIVQDDLFMYAPMVAHATFYLYEPLWLSKLPKEEVYALYERLLSRTSGMYIYCSCMLRREVPVSLFLKNGFTLVRQCNVSQNVMFNWMLKRYNSLEFWFKSDS